MDESAACYKQLIGDDKRLYCTIAVEKYREDRYERLTSTDFCSRCPFGESAREVKCPHLDGEVPVFEYADSDGRNSYPGVVTFYCTQKQNEIDPAVACRNCTERENVDFTLPTLQTVSYLESVGCGEAAHHLREALDILNAQDRSRRDNEAAVNHAANALAAGFKFLSAKYGNETGKTNIEELWKEYVKASKYDPDTNRYNFITNELIRKLQLIRHSESVAHPDPRTPTDAEARFYVTLVSAILHYFVRKAGEEGKLLI